MGLLRLILAVSVVLTHSGPFYGIRFVGGIVAVQVFYIMSGFYMALILNEKYIGINGSYKLFITNRLLRLYPVYWTVLFCSILFSIAVFIHSHGNKGSFIQPYLDYFSSMNFSSFCFLLFTNLFLFFQDIVLFMGLDTTTGQLYFTPRFYESNPPLYTFLLIPQAWTIGVELTFYVFAPFFVRKKSQLIVFLICLSILLRMVLMHYGYKGDPWLYRFFPTELVFFLLGILSYKIYSKVNKTEINKFYLKTIWVLIIVFTLFYDQFSLFGKMYIYFITLFLGLPFLFILTSKWKKDLYMGDLSYPIYISHIFVLACMNGLKIPMVGGVGLSLTIGTVVFSILLNEFVTKRIEKIRRNRIKPVYS